MIGSLQASREDIFNWSFHVGEPYWESSTIVKDCELTIMHDVANHKKNENRSLRRSNHRITLNESFISIFIYDN